VLCGAIARQTGIPHNSSDARRIDDGPATRLQHRRNFTTHAVEYAFQIDGDHSIECRFFLVRKSKAAAPDAGVVERYVEAPERTEGDVNHAHALGVMTDVDLNELRISACLAHKSRRPLAFNRVGVGHQHPSALRRKGEGSGTADASATPGHEDRLAREAFRH